MSSTLSEILAVHGLDENDLKRKVSADHWEELIEIAEDWKAVGVVLGFDQDELDLIDEVFRSSELDKFCLYVEWIKLHEENATYLKLAEQLLAGEQRDLLNYLCGILARDELTDQLPVASDKLTTSEAASPQISSSKKSTTLSEVLVIHGLDKTHLLRTLSKEHRQQLTKRIENWKAVGAVIGFAQDELDIIDQEYENVEQKKTNLIIQWIVRYRDEATYLKLAEQLLAGEQRDLLNDLCGILASDEVTDPSSVTSDKPSSSEVNTVMDSRHEGTLIQYQSESQTREESSDASQQLVQATGNPDTRGATSVRLRERDIGNLLCLLQSHSFHWNNIGIALSFLPSELSTISSMPLLLLRAPTSYLQELLSQWVQWPTASHPTEPTLEALCAALRGSLVGLGSLADKVNEEMRQSTGKSSTALLSKDDGVSLSPISQSLEEKLTKFPSQFLDSPCSDPDLVKLSQSIIQWRDLSPYLRLSPAEETRIITAFPPASPARQCIDMLRTWREKFGTKANYRCLITSLYEANRVDLIGELQRITTLQTISPREHVIVSQRVEWYGVYLKKQYVEVLFSGSIHVSANKWLPSPTKRIYKLAIIKKEKIQRGAVDDEFVQQTIRGKVDDILLKKSPIELKELFQNIEGERKVILIDGAPGSGKSTLTLHISRSWGRGQLFNEFTVVILVQLRDPKVQSAQSIVDLIPSKDRAMAERAAQEILAIEGSGVLWVLDGWDELPPNLQKQSIISALVKPILHQENPLSKSAIIVTSRPISSGDLCPVVSSRIEVLGFTGEEQRLFFTECLNNDKEAVDSLMERLSSNPAMEGSCYLPLNASIVAHLYLTNGSLPSTIYGIFSSLVQHFISRYLYERKGISLELATFESLDGLPPELQALFQQLCEVAFTGAKDNKVTFSSSDLEALRASKEVCELGLLQAVPSIVSYGRSVYHNFVHLSIQEMLSAVHISQMPAADQIKTFDSMFNEARFSAILEFYAAITKFRTSRPLLNLVPRLLRSVPASVYDLVRKIIRKESKNLLVSLLNCLYEAQDISLCKYVGEQLRDKMAFLDRLRGDDEHLYLLGKSLLPRDCLSIGYFLASISVSYKGEFRVDLGDCSLGDAGTKILMQSLCRSLDPHSKITGHLCMNLRYNSITEVGASYIAEVLRSTRALRKLYLWSSPIHSNVLQSIVEALTTNTSLINLYMYNCSLTITEESGPSLTDMLQRNKTLKVLDLSANSYLSDRQASFIINGLKENTTLKTLNLIRCGFTDEGIRLIKSSTTTCKINCTTTIN